MEDKIIRAIKEVAMDSFEDKCTDLINNGYSIIAIDVLIAPMSNNTIWTAVLIKSPVGDMHGFFKGCFPT